MTTVFSAFPLLMGTSAGGEATSGSMVTTFVTFGLIIAVFYFLIIRPQKKKEKETKDMIGAVKKGDKVVTIGGIRGTVTSVKEDAVVVKVDDTTKIEFSKGAISSIINKKDDKPAAAKKPAAKKPAAVKKTVAAKKPAAVQKPAAAKKPAAKKTTVKKPVADEATDSAVQDEEKK